jgi:hypothetical protein
VIAHAPAGVRDAAAAGGERDWLGEVLLERRGRALIVGLGRVRHVKDQLWNASVQGTNAADRKNAFLTWCGQWATPQPGNHFPDSEDLFGSSPTAITAWCRLRKQTRKQDRVYI